MAGIIFFYSTHRTCTLDPGILYPYCATGICNRCRTSWCLQRNMEHRYSLQDTIYCPCSEKSKSERAGSGLPTTAGYHKR